MYVCVFSAPFRIQREAWITAKYLKRAFVSKLPEVKTSSGSGSNRIKSWSVRKKTRRSPARALDKGNSKEELSPSDSDDVTSGLMEGRIPFFFFLCVCVCVRVCVCVCVRACV